MKIVDHAHCEQCQNVIAPAERWCSPECEQKHEEGQAYKKKQARILLIAAVITLIALMLIQMGYI